MLSVISTDSGHRDHATFNLDTVARICYASPMRSTLITLSLVCLLGVGGCSIVGSLGKRETKFEEPPAYLSVPPAERKASSPNGQPNGVEPLVTPQPANSLPWMMSDRAKEINRGIDAKHK
ncbi:MAG: hypothetical protein ACRC46_03370 [Thermoguttaceae bacterium]